MMAEEERIKCGVAGVGYLGQHHARIYGELENCELVGVFDVDECRSREVAEANNCDCYPSLSELADACHAVSVSVPTDKHGEVAIALLEAGCHILIEKPLCVSLREAEEILAAARNSGTIVQVGHIEHFNPMMAFLEQAVNQPMYITADRLAPFDARGTEVGVVLDLMIHDIGVILTLVKSSIAKIESVGVSVLSSTEDIANARIVFESGCVANINASRVSQKKVREIRVFQSNAYLSLDFMNQKGHLMRKEGNQLSREEIPIEKGEPLSLEIDSFVECVSRFKEPKVGATLGKSALEVAIQITEQISEVSKNQYHNECG